MCCLSGSLLSDIEQLPSLAKVCRISLQNILRIIPQNNFQTFLNDFDLISFTIEAIYHWGEGGVLIWDTFYQRQSNCLAQWGVPLQSEVLTFVEHFNKIELDLFVKIPLKPSVRNCQYKTIQTHMPCNTNSYQSQCYQWNLKKKTIAGGQQGTTSKG